MLRLTFLTILYLAAMATSQEVFSIVLTAPLFIIIAINVQAIRTPFLTRDDVFWFCMFLFFVVGPCQMIHDNQIGNPAAETLVTTYEYSRAEFVQAMAIVVAFAGAFTVGVISRRNKKGAESQANARSINMPFLAWMVGLSFAMCIVLSGGLANLLAPRLDQDFDATYKAFPLALAAQTVATALIAASWREKLRWNNRRLPCLIIALALLAICQNPFNTPRFFLLAGWTPTLLALCRGRFRAALFYPACLFGVIVLMPILSATSRHGVTSLRDLDSVVTTENFRQAPFLDVFDTLVHSVRFMSYTPPFDGQKTLAIALFFVPRDLWPGKPIVGGLDIGNELHSVRMAGTSNLSFFVGGDFYMDFGFAGVLCGGFLCGYWFLMNSRGGAGRESSRDRILEYIIIGSIPILVRGPVGAVLPLVTCQVLTLWSIQFLISRPDPRRMRTTLPIRPIATMVDTGARSGRLADLR